VRAMLNPNVQVDTKNEFNLVIIYEVKIILLATSHSFLEKAQNLVC
jgi:hypothetical protein